MSSVAGELLAAADRLEALAGAATEGPWEAHLHEFEPETAEVWGDVKRKAGATAYTQVAQGVTTEDAKPEGPWLTGEDAAYIAAMGPDRGLLLAKWLRHEGQGAAAGLGVLQPVLDLARAINRSET